MVRISSCWLDEPHHQCHSCLTTNVIPAEAGIQGLRDNMRFMQKPKLPRIGKGNPRLRGGI